MNKSQVAEIKPNKVRKFSLTQNSKTSYLMPVSKSKSVPKIPKKVAFEPSPEEREIIQAAQGKHGNFLKATDILRMALKRLAETDGLQKAS